MRKEERVKTLWGTIIKYKYIRGISEETLYKRVNMGESTYYAKRKNPDKFTISELIEMLDFLGVPREEREI